MLKELITFALFMYAPLVLKLISYQFYKDGALSYLKQDPKRADIIDCDGKILATTIPTQSLYIVPYEFIYTNEQAKSIANQLSKILNVSQEYILSKIYIKSKKFGWILRHIAPWQAKEIAKMGLHGIYLAKDFRRFYPSGSLFVHIIGRVDDQNNGISGLEKAFDSYLKSSSEPLKLSLNSNIQFKVKDVLYEGKKYYRAKHLGAIVVSVPDGRILAMYTQNEDHEINPHENYELTGENINVITQIVYERGSVFKVINAAMLISYNLVDWNKKMFAPGRMKVGKHWVSDFKRTGDCYYTFLEAFKRSSNVIHGKMAHDAGAEKQLAFFKLCGFFETTKIDDLGSVRNLFPKKWKPVNRITASYGHGMAVTIASFMQAMLRVLTGKAKRLHILQDYKKSPEEDVQIIDKSVGQKLQYLLREYVKDGYNEKKYGMQDYDIGGKTGTANQLKGGQYIEKLNNCNAVLIYPASNPRIIVFVTVHEPEAAKDTFGYTNAGFNAMPLAMQIVKLIAPLV